MNNDIDKIAPYKELRQKLEYYRKKNKLTQDNVVAKLSEKGIYVDRSSISHWESGSEPNFNTLCALAEIYNVTLEDLKPGRIIVEDEKKLSDKKAKTSDYEDISSFLEAVTDEVDRKNENVILHRTVDYFNKKQNENKESGAYVIDVDYIKSILGSYGSSCISLGIHVLPLIAHDLFHLGYPIDYASGSSINDVFFTVSLVGKKDSVRAFERDLTNILVKLYSRARNDNIDEQDAEIVKKANEARDEYVAKIDDLMYEVLKSTKYTCEYENNNGHFDISGISRRRMIDFLKNVNPESVWFGGVPGSIAIENIDTLDRAYEEDSNEDLRYHVYWLAEEGGEYIDKEEDFAHNKKELIELLKTRKRNHFSIFACDDELKNPIFEALQDKVIPTSKIDEVVRVIASIEE